jgi:hypothetical protein
LEEKIAVPVQKSENTAVWIRRADHATPSISAARSIVRSRIQAMEFVFCLFLADWSTKSSWGGGEGTRNVISSSSFQVEQLLFMRYLTWSLIKNIVVPCCPLIFWTEDR